MTSLVYNDGTASVTNGSAVVTGNGTAWEIALVAGGMFSLAGLSVPILSVDTDTKLTLAYPWPGGDEDDVAYAIARETSQAVRAAWINDRLASFHQKPWGIGVEPDGRGTLDERDALDPMPSDYYCWLRVEVDEPVELYFKVPSGWLGPYPILGEDGPIGPPGPALVPAGEWVAETNYPRGRYVSHGGRTFASKVNENEGNEPPDADEDDAFWMFVPLPVGPKGDKGDQGDKGDKGDKGDTGVIWRGAYSGATTYAANDAVRDNGSSWLALQETTGNAPPTLPTTSNAYWELLAAKGTDGVGTGDVVGPASSTDGVMALFDGTSGKLLKAGSAPFSGDYDDLDNKPTLGTMAAETASDYTKTSGLGGAALLNVGTTAGTVAAGDDSRFDGNAKLAVEDQSITGGARITSKSLGTVSSGTLTPDPGDRPLQHYVNDGAHTLAPGSNTGSYLLDISNGADAGPITTSGWTKVSGDAFTTTNGHKFRCHCSVGDGGSLLIIQALQ